MAGLTEEIKAEIKRLDSQGMEPHPIARQLGIQRVQVLRVLAGTKPKKITRKQAQVEIADAKAVVKVVKSRVMRENGDQEDDRITQKVDELTKQCREIYEKAMQDDRLGVAVQATIAEVTVLKSQVQLMEIVKGMIEDDIRRHPTFIEFRGLIMRALEKHPDAKRDVIEALINVV